MYIEIRKVIIMNGESMFPSCTTIWMKSLKELTPTGSTTVVEKTQLTAPGRPGAITEDPEEQRGYHVKLETPAATTTTIRVNLIVVPKA